MTGHNNKGQLGLNDFTNRNSFTEVSGSWKQALMFSGGGLFSLAAKDDSILWATGCNVDGQLGIGNEIDKEIFTETVDVTPSTSEIDVWKRVVCGEYHAMAIKIN